MLISERGIYNKNGYIVRNKIEILQQIFISCNEKRYFKKKCSPHGIWDMGLYHGIWDCPIPRGAVLSKYDTEDNLIFSYACLWGKTHLYRVIYQNLSI